jgi:hypothetical protein
MGVERLKFADAMLALDTVATNAQVIDKLYLNVLHCAGEAGGVAYWNSILDNGHANVAAVLASFSESAENIAALIGVLDDGVAYLPFG